MRSLQTKKLQQRAYALASLFLLSQLASADTHTWTGDNNNAWGNAGNWSSTGGGIPANSDDVIYYDSPFSGNAIYAGLNNSATTSTERRANSITFSADITSDFAINPRGDSAVLDPAWNHFLGIQGNGGITDDSANSATITLNVDVNLRANQDWKISAGNTFVANEEVRGAFRLDKLRTGTLVMNGDNTYSGGTQIGNGNNESANTLQIGVDSVGSVGSITSSAIGTGTLTTLGARISSDSSAPRTIYNSVVFGAGGGSSAFLGDAVNNGTLTFEGPASFNSNRSIQVDSPVFYNGAISESGGTLPYIAKSGSGSLTLGGLNTYPGDTQVRAGLLTLADSGQLLFDIEADGVGTSVNGAGSAIFEGTFFLDLDTAEIADGNSWTLASVSTQTFNNTFDVDSTLGVSFVENSDIWTALDGNNTWTFTESTGDLTLAVIPEPSTSALIALAGLAFFRRRRRT